jgi:hypothetical protein
MKKIRLPESKVLRSVRQIKEAIAQEAQGSPEYYMRLNGFGAKLLGRYRSPRPKNVRH